MQIMEIIETNRNYRSYINQAPDDSIISTNGCEAPDPWTVAGRCPDIGGTMCGQRRDVTWTVAGHYLDSGGMLPGQWRDAVWTVADDVWTVAARCLYSGGTMPEMANPTNRT